MSKDVLELLLALQWDKTSLAYAWSLEVGLGVYRVSQDSVMGGHDGTQSLQQYAGMGRHSGISLVSSANLNIFSGDLDRL